MTEEERVVFREFTDKTGIDFASFRELDPPDFVSTDGSTAFELVEYHEDFGPRGSPKRKAEEGMKKLVEEAKRKYFRSSPAPKPLDAFFLASHQWNGYTSSMQGVLAEVVGLATEHQDSPTEFDVYALSEALQEVFWHIGFNPTPPYQKESVWQYLAVAFADVLPEVVGQIIQKKEEKLTLYRTHAKQVCLLIYASVLPGIGSTTRRVTPSTCGRINQELIETTYDTRFDRVYYFDRDRMEVARLTLSAKTMPLAPDPSPAA